MILQTLLGLTFLLALFALGFGVLEQYWPSLTDQPRRRGILTDTLYWFAHPLVIQPLNRLINGLALVPILLLLGRSLDPETLQTGYGPLTQIPPPLQMLIILVIGDFFGYWIHRGFHSQRGWSFHAIHHSSTQLNWLSSLRVHPINDLIAGILQSIPFVILGFSATVTAAFLPFLMIYGLLIHANVAWDFGPLRYILASPTFHRWHHAESTDGSGHNFAGLFPIYDLIFGTLYLPQREQPRWFGITGDPVPESFWGQLVYPFRQDQ